MRARQQEHYVVELSELPTFQINSLDAAVQADLSSYMQSGIYSNPGMASCMSCGTTAEMAQHGYSVEYEEFTMSGALGSV
jgi:hypothetical protein